MKPVFQLQNGHSQSSSPAFMREVVENRSVTFVVEGQIARF